MARGKGRFHLSLAESNYDHSLCRASVSFEADQDLWTLDHFAIMSQSAKTHQPWTSEKHPASTSSLISSLEALRADNPRAVKSTVHHYPARIYDSDPDAESSCRDRKIASWKMTEHLYFSASNPFPTLARGLFTEDIEEGDDIPDEAVKCEGEWDEGVRRKRIVARGYDKFFNVDEVDWTNVSRANPSLRFC